MAPTARPQSVLEDGEQPAIRRDKRHPVGFEAARRFEGGLDIVEPGIHEVLERQASNDGIGNRERKGLGVARVAGKARDA